MEKDLEIRALSQRVFEVDADLPDGRKIPMTRLVAAPEVLLKAVVNDFGRSLTVELVGDDG